MDLTLEEIFDLEDEVLGNFAFSEDTDWSETRGSSERGKNCETGKPCGDTCISKDKECKEVKSGTDSSVRRDFKRLIAFGKESLRDVFDEEAATKEEAKIDALLSESGSLKKQIKKARGEEKKTLKERLKEVEAEISSMAEPLNQRFEDVLNFLKKDADFGKIKETVEALKFEGLFTDPVNAYKSFASEFLAITQPISLGGLERIEKPRSGDNRAYADSNTASIGMPNFVVEPGQPSRNFEHQKKTLFHEMAHFIEFGDQELARTAKEWVKSRATDEPKQLSKMGNPSYDPDEIAYPDKFLDPYVGKVYENASTEVISMGLEHLAEPWRTRKLFALDPEHFYLTIGTILSGRENQ